MGFKNTLKQGQTSQKEKKRRDQNAASFSTIDSCSTSRFSFQSGFNGNPSPSIRQIEIFSETLIDKQRTPIETQSYKSMTSFSDIVNHLQENEEKCHKISEQIDESFTDDSDDDEHCIWDNSEAEEFGIDCKDFLNAEQNALNFYQLYSIRSQLYQPNRVLRSTTIEEVHTLSKFYNKPIKFTDLMSHQTYLDNSCALFQQLPSLNQSDSQNPTSPTKCATERSQEQSEKLPLQVNISCVNSRNKVEVKNIDLSLILKKNNEDQQNENCLTSSVKQQYSTRSLAEQNTTKTATLSTIASNAKLQLTTSVKSPSRAVPIKKFNLNEILSPISQSLKTMPDFDTSFDIDSVKQPSTLTNIPCNIPINQAIQINLTPTKKMIRQPSKNRNNNNSSVERLNTLRNCSSASKSSYTSITNLNIATKKISFQSNLNLKSKQEIVQQNKCINNKLQGLYLKQQQLHSPHSLSQHTKSQNIQPFSVVQ